MEATASGTSERPEVEGELGIARLFLADLRFAFVVLNQVPYLALNRLLGVSREQANVITVVLALIAVDAAHARAQRIAGASLPVSGAAVTVTAMREGALRIAGPSARDIPLFGTPVAVAVIWGSALPGLRRAARSIRTTEKRLRRERIRPTSPRGLLATLSSAPRCEAQRG
jgi:hypothetical protein